MEVFGPAFEVEQTDQPLEMPIGVRIVRLAHMGRYMVIDRQMEKLREKMNRWTYRGRPTRKAQRLQILEDRLEDYGRTHLADLL